jgi:hypothetical protein
MGSSRILFTHLCSSDETQVVMLARAAFICRLQSLCGNHVGVFLAVAFNQLLIVFECTAIGPEFMY